jgi:hypothetical protein
MSVPLTAANRETLGGQHARKVHLADAGVGGRFDGPAHSLGCRQWHRIPPVLLSAPFRSGRVFLARGELAVLLRGRAFGVGGDTRSGGSRRRSAFPVGHLGSPSVSTSVSHPASMPGYSMHRVNTRHDCERRSTALPTAKWVARCVTLPQRGLDEKGREAVEMFTIGVQRGLGVVAP